MGRIRQARRANMASCLGLCYLLVVIMFVKGTDPGIHVDERAN